MVPNPYRDDGAHAYPSKGQVRITNVPYHCLIKIYTVAGDLMWSVTHNDPTKGEYTWLMLGNDFIEDASSGLYYLYVESLVPGHEGKTQSTSLMVVK